MIVDYDRYLIAKRSVDDRAINQRVWRSLQQALPERRLRVLEVGAGVGTMIERILDWGLLAQADYVALERDEALLVRLQQRLAAAGFRRRHGVWQKHGFAVQALAGDLQRLPVQSAGQFDLLLAHAVLDIVDLEPTLPILLQQLRSGGLFLFSHVFDGVTVFEPIVEPSFDRLIVRLYHDTMRVGGYSGRLLQAQLRNQPVRLLANGAADWMVTPEGHGYAADEAAFLHAIITTVEGALADHAQLEQQRLQQWVAARRAQIAQGRLIYLAQQIDVVGRLL